MSTVPKHQRLTAGRSLILINGLFIAIGAFYFDFNETHVYNPRWPPHARFHNGQTMSLGTLLGAATIYYLFRPTKDVRDSLWAAALIGSMYEFAGLSALWYPGSKAMDPEFGDAYYQIYLFSVGLAFNWAGWWIESRREGVSGKIGRD